VVINMWHMCHAWQIVSLKIAHEYYSRQKIFFYFNIWRLLFQLYLAEV